MSNQFESNRATINLQEVIKFRKTLEWVANVIKYDLYSKEEIIKEIEITLKLDKKDAPLIE